MFSKTVRFLLLLTVATGCGRNPLRASPIESFIGFWFNEDPSTAGNTKVEIVRNDNNVVVHMWGACIPQDCDWGTISVLSSSVTDGVMDLTWPTFFSVTTQRLTITQTGRLRVDSFTRFTDNSGRASYSTVELFFK